MPPKGGKSGGRSTSHSKPKSFGGSHHGHHHHKTTSFGFGSRSRSIPRSNGHALGARHRFHHHHGTKSRIGYGFVSARTHMALPTPPGPFYTPGRLSYRGTVENLRAQFSALAMQDQSTIREITLCLTGNIVQQEGKCCKALTCIAGMLCFFPFLLNCCDCYRRNVEKLYSISDT